MKRVLIFIFIFFVAVSLEAQVKVDVNKKVSNETNQRANQHTDKAVDKAFNKLEEGIGSLFKKKKKKKKRNQLQEEQVQQNTSTEQSGELANEQEQPVQPDIKWNKFDFVPGDIVIFEDVPSTDEENGEFPSRWDLHEGNAEIAEVDGVNVIVFPHGGVIVPYLKNSKEDYLPDVFTLEFDAYFDVENHHRFWITLYDKKNQSGIGKSSITFYPSSVSFGNSTGEYPKELPSSGWRHFSVAFTKGKLKVYLNDTRLVNLPHVSINPTGITFENDGYGADKTFQYLKNFRIAKGGVKYYDRVLSDGKIIVNGIRFDVNKATIKPESNGAINKIYQLMGKQPELNFSVEGHTDSDGDDALNQTLSEARAKAVMERLISLGISANRLKYAGWGESKPIGENGTAEGKANNRRVEFVKFSGSATPSNSSSNSVFDKLDSKTIGTQLDALPNERIQISVPSGILLDAGTIILFATSDGNLGKMEFLNIDKNDNYKLTIKYVTYNNDSSVHSKSDHLEIEGTYTCDLDKGTTEDVIHSAVDFSLGRTDNTNTVLWPGEESMLRVYNN